MCTRCLPLYRAQAKASKDQVVLTNKQIAYLLGEFVLVRTQTLLSDTVWYNAV